LAIGDPFFRSPAILYNHCPSTVNRPGSTRTVQLNRRYQRPLVRKEREERLAVSIRGPRPDPQILVLFAVFASFVVKYLGSVASFYYRMISPA